MTLTLSNWLTDWLTIVKNITKGHSQTLVNIETFDKSDEETWPDQQKDNDNDKDKDNDKDI